MPIGVALLIVILLLLLNAFFVLAEFAIVKIRGSRVEELLRSGNANAVYLKDITEHLDAHLSSIQLGITMASLGLGWAGEPAVARLVGRALHALPNVAAGAVTHTLSFGIAFSLITFLHVVVGELAPKSVAIRYPTRSSLLIAIPLTLFSKLFFLPMRALNGTSNLLLRLLRLDRPDPIDVSHSTEELRILLAQLQEGGRMPLTRLLLFENLFDFANTTVDDVMTPAGEIACLSLEKPWSENLALIQSRRYSRYPLVGRDLNDVRGAVHIKDILLTPGAQTPDLNALKREILVVPERMPLDKIMDPLRSRRTNMAIVRNKAGETTGLVTLEDVLEELVGEIQDEFSPPRTYLFSELVIPDAIDLSLPQTFKEEAYQTLLKRLVQAAPAVDYEKAWKALWTREMSLSSAVGRGVAIPHARLPNIEQAYITIGRFARGLEMDARDRKPVRLVFMILSPLHQPGTQLHLLARIAALVSNATVQRGLIHAKTPREVFDILAAFDQTMTD